MELNELLELSKGERAIIKSRIESILLERVRGEGRDLIRDIMKNFDEDLIEIIERVLNSGIALRCHGFINQKSRKFRIWRNRTFRKIRRIFE